MLPGFGIYYHCNPVSPDAQGLRSIASWVDAGLAEPGRSELSTKSGSFLVLRCILSFADKKRLRKDPQHAEGLALNLPSLL